MIHPKIAIIGDLHGKYKEYLAITKKYEHTIQVGDFGFNYSILNQIDSTKHKVVAGNHCNYDELYKWPHYLGDFGTAKLAFLDFFFIRGAFSIDGEYRRQAEMAGGLKTWWKEEELCRHQMDDCCLEYEKVKPSFVISHDCPLSISRRFSNSPILKSFGFNPETFQTNTGLLLEELFRIHQPRMWIFGHHHQSHRSIVKDCEFICLKELEVLELNELVS